MGIVSMITITHDYLDNCSKKKIIRLQLKNKNMVENYRCVKQQAIPIYCFIINDLIEVSIVGLFFKNL